MMRCDKKKEIQHKRTIFLILRASHIKAVKGLMQNEVTFVKQYTSHVLVIYRTNFWLLSLFTDLISYNTVSASLASVKVVDRSDGQQGPCGDTILIFLKNSIYKDTEMLEVKKVSETILNVALFVTSSLLVKKNHSKIKLSLFQV